MAKYKAYISYEFYDSIEIEADSYDEAEEMAYNYAEESDLNTRCDQLNVEVEEVEE